MNGGARGEKLVFFGLEVAKERGTVNVRREDAVHSYHVRALRSVNELFETTDKKRSAVWGGHLHIGG